MDNNLSFNIPTTLPSPDQMEGNASAPGQSSGASTTSKTTATGGATGGVNAAKGASTAVGINPLIVDQSLAQSTATGSGSSGMGMDAASILGEAPTVDLQSMMTSLGKVADDLDQISGVINSIASDLSSMPGFRSVGGSVKGDKGTKAERGDQSHDGKKTEGKGNGEKAAEGSSPSADDSVSKAVSPTGAVTTTTSTESTSSSGDVTTSSTTTVSDGTSSSSNEASTSTTSSGESTEGTISMTQIMDDIGSLENQESATLAQQQTSEIDAIELQASDTDAQAADMDKGAMMMMDMATIGLAVSVAGAAYQAQGIYSASQAGDQMQMETMDQQNQELEDKMEASSNQTEEAIKDPKPENISAAENSITQSRQLVNRQKNAGGISEEQAASMNQQLDAQSRVLENVQHKNDATYQGSKTHIQATEDANAAGHPASINNAEDAAAFYNKQATDTAATRFKGISFSDLHKQGIRPGQTVSDEDAAHVLGTNDSGKVQAFQAHVKSLSTSRNTTAWNQGFNNASQHLQANGAVFSALSNLFSQGLSNMEDQQYQAAGTEESAASQVEQSNEQSMQQGVSQTEDVANQLRQEQSAVAQDMQTMVGSTKA